MAAKKRDYCMSPCPYLWERGTSTARMERALSVSLRLTVLPKGEPRWGDRHSVSARLAAQVSVKNCFSREREKVRTQNKDLDGSDLWPSRSSGLKNNLPETKGRIGAATTAACDSVNSSAAALDANSVCC